MTAPFAEVIGDPIAQSKSPVIHNFWLGKLGIAADYRKEQVTADQLSDYLANRRNNPAWRGCNVTMPHKQAVMAHLDQIEPQAAAIGAVNTIIRGEGGVLIGTNTDAPGFIEPLQPYLEKPQLFKMARILGTGGAARAIITALAHHGFTIVLAGRNPDKARAILDELASEGEHHPIALNHFAQATDFAFDDREGCLDLIVNASPLGMRGQQELAFDWSHAPPGSIAYDIVTDPLETAFLTNARAGGFEAIDGLSMLIGQADHAFARFFGQSAPRECDDELRKALQG